MIDDLGLAAAVADAITTDMQPANSWNAASDDPDQYASSGKRLRAWLMSWLPLTPVL